MIGKGIKHAIAMTEKDRKHTPSMRQKTDNKQNKCFSSLLIILQGNMHQPLYDNKCICIFPNPHMASDLNMISQLNHHLSKSTFKI